MVKIDPYWRTADETRRLHIEYLQQTDSPIGKTLEEIKEQKKHLAELEKPVTTVMIMQDLPEMRETFVLNRGQYDSPDKTRPVEADVPGLLPKLAPDLPNNRLGEKNDCSSIAAKRQAPLYSLVETTCLAE